MQHQEELKEQIKIKINNLRSSLDVMEEYLNDGHNAGLGGQLQNVWDLYHAMGQYELLLKMFPKEKED